MKKLLSFITIISLIPFMWPQMASANLSTGLVGYWSMDSRDGTAQGITIDRSGSGNTGTLNGGVTQAIGKIGQGLKFASSSSQYVNMGNPSNLPAQPPFTISAWVNGSVYQSGNTIIGRWDSYSQSYLLTDTFCGSVNSSPNTFDAYSYYYTAPSSGWYSVACTVTGNTVKVYINGAYQGTGALWFSGGDSHGSTPYFFVGAYNNVSPSGYFSGTIDDVRIYNRALSAGEVFQLWMFGLQSHAK